MVKKPDLPYLSRNTVRKGGKVYEYWQFRRGKTKLRLPGNPDTPDFHTAYWEARAGRAQPTGCSFRDLIESYRQSPRFDVSPRTKADYERVLLYLREKIGGMDCRKMERHHVIEAQQALAAQGRKRFANAVPTMLSILFEHAIDIGWRTTNPAAKVRKIKTGEGWSHWPEPALAAYRATAEGPARLVFELALGTGQRADDVLRMTWGDVEDDGINVVQAKTGAVLWIPFTDELAAYLGDIPRGIGNAPILAMRNGRPYAYRHIKRLFDRARDAAGIEGLTLHGLRKNATVALFEAGCSDEQVKAITGHETREMLRLYGKGARQKKLARQVREIRRKGE